MALRWTGYSHGRCCLPSGRPRAEGIDAETEIIRVERSLVIGERRPQRAEEAATVTKRLKGRPILQAIAIFASDPSLRSPSGI